MLHCIIMAGGSGTRLWPESCEERPKQFMKIQGEKTMLAQTFDRIVNLTPPANIWISTGESMLNPVRESLPEISPSRIIAEPAARNTAPCIGLAAIRVLREDPDATMLVVPADQIIEPAAEFRNCVRVAVGLIGENPDRLITFGIKPTFPAESYGYIECGNRVDESRLNAFDVLKFHEKPDAEKAAAYIESGSFFWNSGIFVWKARRIIELLKEFEPGIGDKLDAISAGVINPDFVEILRTEFESMKKISIDHAVLERSQQIIVLEATFEWDDIGTWRSLDRINRDKHDSDGNLADRGRLIAIDSGGNVVRSNDPQHVFALLGVENLIVIQTETATLIAKKDREESVRQVLDQLRRNSG